jgi:hypothetical protein
VAPASAATVPPRADALDLDALARSAQPRFEARAEPFRHWVAADVFPSSTLALLESSFREILARGLSEPADPRRLSRRMTGYDAYSLSLTRLGGAIELFQTRPWHDLLADLTGVRGTLDVSAAIHHHVVGSESGKVHNDFNPAFFADNPQADGINVNDPKICNYQHGEVFQKGRTSRACARAVAMLYYFANPVWKPGDGGETGLYRFPKQPVGEPSAAVPPVNNSMLVFEVTPTSFHSFLSNRRAERNCAVLWLHRTRAEAVQRWGEGKLVEWKR